MLVKKSLVQGFFCVRVAIAKLLSFDSFTNKIWVGQNSFVPLRPPVFQWVQIKKIFQPLNIESSDYSTICVQFLKTKTPIVLMLADTRPPPTLLGPSSFSGTSGRQQAGLSRLQGGQLCFDALERESESFQGGELCFDGLERESERRLLRV